MESNSHLSLILDLSPSAWYQSSLNTSENVPPLPLSMFLAQILAFINSHLAQKAENSLAIFGAFPARSVMLYSSLDILASGPAEPSDANWYLPFKVVDSTVMTRIQEEVDSLPSNGDEEETPCALIFSSFSRVEFSFREDINRLFNSALAAKVVSKESNLSRLDPRILILSVSPDQSASYVPLMNSIFSAQKLKVVIDVCKLFGMSTVFLQQAAHLTGGSYIHMTQRDTILQHLIMCFLAPPSLRSAIEIPSTDKVDFRAACFCHKDIVDIGFVCSVCLSIFCQPVPVCSTCRTKFPLQTLKRLGAARMPTTIALGANGTTNGKRATSTTLVNGQA